MVEEKSFAPNHAGYIHDMCLDYYGRRLATCSEDGFVKIFRRAQASEGWEFVCDLRPEHNGAVIKIAWSHPEFSMLLASASTDHCLIIWEEENENKWKQLQVHKDFTSAITGLEFGPKHLGIRLAVCLEEGKVIIISPTDVLRKEWIVIQSFAVGNELTNEVVPKYGVSSISWNTFPYDLPSLVVGSASGKVASIWRMDKDRKRWRETEKFKHDAAVNHVAWAPNLGRSFHMIATASSDGTAKIWRVKGKAKDDDESILRDGVVEVSLIQTLPHEVANKTCEVFQVEWNLTATTLATSCDDGIVRLWSPNFKGEWTLQLSVDQK